CGIGIGRRPTGAAGGVEDDDGAAGLADVTVRAAPVGMATAPGAAGGVVVRPRSDAVVQTLRAARDTDEMPKVTRVLEDEQVAPESAKKRAISLAQHLGGVERKPPLQRCVQTQFRSP